MVYAKKREGKGKLGEERGTDFEMLAREKGRKKRKESR